jgi:hypothetical protein
MREKRQYFRGILRQVTWLLLLNTAAFLPQGVKAQALSAAAAEEQAIRLYERFNAAPITDVQVLEAMTNDILSGRADSAAFRAMNSPTLGFYRTTLKAMFNPLSTPDRNQVLPLNDFSATIVGLVRNNEEFNQVLYGDVIYVGAPETTDYYSFVELGGDAQTAMEKMYCGMDRDPATQCSYACGGDTCIAPSIEISNDRRRLTLPDHGLTEGQRYQLLDGTTTVTHFAYVIDEDQIEFVNVQGAPQNHARDFYLGVRGQISSNAGDAVRNLLHLQLFRLRPIDSPNLMPVQKQDGYDLTRAVDRFGIVDIVNLNEPRITNLTYRAFNADGELRNTLLNPITVPLLRRENTGGRYSDNNHYTLLERFAPTNWPSLLAKRTQTELYSQTQATQSVAPEDVMGLITLRQMAMTNFTAGTNRAAFSNVMSSFYCKDMRQLHDPSAPDNRVRRDISRSPFSVYSSDCRGCHAGMDAMTGAFSYLDFNVNNSTLEYRRNVLGLPANNNDNVGVTGPRKLYRAHLTYPQGHLPIDNTWINHWTAGPNVTLGWRIPDTGESLTSGTGAHTLGKVLGHTQAFSECMARRTFEQVCNRPPTGSEQNNLKDIALLFQNGMGTYASEGAGGPYNMRALFAKVTPMCWGRSE